jgi:hypothetical protein
MERRMQLVKRDNEKERHKLLQGYEPEEREEAELSEKIKLERQPELCETSQALPSKPFSCGRSGKGHKRCAGHFILLLKNDEELLMVMEYELGVRGLAL